MLPIAGDFVPVSLLPEMTAVIQTRGLSKSYAGFDAVIDVSLRVEPNEIYGFLGPNGAGKTTTIMMLLGLTPPTRGEAHIFGTPAPHRDFATRCRMGVVGERQVFYEDMTAQEYLRFFGHLYQVDNLEVRIHQLLERVNLLPAADARARDFSRGMQQKLGFVRALLHDPDLLILDEPVSALDPRGVVEIRALLLEEVARGKTVLISSHLLTEVEQLAQRIGIMNRGRLVVEDSLSNIRRLLQPEARIQIELAGSAQQHVPLLDTQPGIASLSCAGSLLTIHLQDSDVSAARARISRLITQAGGVIIDMRTEEMSLEDAFVSITEQNVHQLIES